MSCFFGRGGRGGYPGVDAICGFIVLFVDSVDVDGDVEVDVEVSSSLLAVVVDALVVGSCFVRSC